MKYKKKISFFLFLTALKKSFRTFLSMIVYVRRGSRFFNYIFLLVEKTIKNVNFFRELIKATSLEMNLKFCFFTRNFPFLQHRYDKNTNVIHINERTWQNYCRWTGQKVKYERYYFRNGNDEKRSKNELDKTAVKSRRKRQIVTYRVSERCHLRSQKLNIYIYLYIYVYLYK